MFPLSSPWAIAKELAKLISPNTWPNFHDIIRQELHLQLASLMPAFLPSYTPSTVLFQPLIFLLPPYPCSTWQYPSQFIQ